MSDTKTQDYIKVNIQDKVSSGAKSIIVTFDLSNAGRVINNRIYPPQGQKNGLETWTKPFEKPVLVHHDLKSEPIGRFIGVQYIDLEKEAVSYLGDARKYLEVKRAFETGDAQTIYKVMKRHSLLNDKNWPGLGKLEARVRISDSAAIEKFQDKRYLTFSAGAKSDSYTCMICGAGWHTGNICEHRPGLADDDGNIGVFMTGNFYGREASVVNEPANNTSSVRNIELSDHFDDAPWMFMDAEKGIDFIMSDSVIETDLLSISDLLELGDEALQTVIKNEIQNISFADLDGESVFEINQLTRIHNSLHYSYDGELKYGNKEEKALPSAVFKLHGRLHDIANSRGFRDSIVNGELDHYDSTGAPSEMYKLHEKNTSDNQTSEEIMPTDTKTEEVVVEDVETVVKTTDSVSDKIPVKVINSLIVQLIGDAELSDADYKGNNWGLVLDTREHRAAALQAIEMVAKVCDEQTIKTVVEAIKDFDKQDIEELAVETITKDYVEALKTIDALKAENEALKTQLQTKETTDSVEETEEISDSVDSSKTDVVESGVEDIEASSNPGLSYQDGEKESKLNSFDKKILATYKTIYTEDGKETADYWFESQARYCSQDFHPSNFLN